MKTAVLDAATLGEDTCLKEFQQCFDANIYQNTESFEVRDRLKEFDILCLNKVRIRPEDLSGARTRLICLFATGTDNVPLQACKEAGIAVCNISGYSTHSVAQHTLALALSVLHQISKYHDFVISGQWRQSEMFTSHAYPYFELQGKKWGIVGMGAIGRAVTHLAKALGCEVQWTSVSGERRNEEASYVSKEELFQTSDVISLHSPLNEHSHHFVDQRALELMQDHAVLINVARGEVLDMQALMHTMREKPLRAALDVYSEEPCEPQSDFDRRLLFTPHIAWASQEARKRVVLETMKNIQSFLAGGRRHRVET